MSIFKKLKRTKSDIKNIEQRIYGVVLCLVILINVVVIVKICNKGKVTMHELNDWTIFTNDGKKEEVDVITDYKIGMANKGSVYVLTRKLSKKDIGNDSIKHPALLFQQINTKIIVYLDGKEIDRCGDKDCFVVSLPPNVYGKEIKVQYEATQNDAFSDIRTINIVDEYDYVTKTMQENFYDILISSFMMLFGAISVVIVLFFSNKNTFFKRVALVGCFMINICIWLFSMSRAFTIFTDNLVIRLIYKYYTIYYGVPVFELLLYTFVERKTSILIHKISVKLITLLVLISTLYTIIEKGTVVYCLMIVERFGCIIIVWSIYAIIKEFKSKTKSEKMLLLSYGILALSLIIEVVLYNLKTSMGEQYISSLYIKIGLAVFITFMIMAYFEYVKEFINNYTEKEELSLKAYQDILTGLYNRSKVMDELDLMKKDKVSEYTIVNLDLNDLKKINDGNGHRAGDMYICTFSRLLKEYLEDDFEIIGRTGGDEFIALSKKCVKRSKLQKNIDKLSKSMEKKCSKFSVNATFAYGYVCSDEIGCEDISVAYKKADERMYECKRDQKNKKLLNI